MSTVVCVPLFFGRFQYGGLVTWTCELCFEVSRQPGRRSRRPVAATGLPVAATCDRYRRPVRVNPVAAPVAG